MRIEVVGDGHVFQGTPQQILMQIGHSRVHQQRVYLLFSFFHRD